ncbi:MAG: hypothetical protein WCL00_14740 [Bacteroidota bacterium]
MKNQFMMILVCSFLMVANSCKKETVPTDPKAYASFSVKGVNQIYYSYSKFTKDLCTTSTYCTQFYYDSDNQETNLIKIGIPGEPIVGHIYKSGDTGFDFYYLSSAGVHYSMTQFSPIQVVFITWEGQGGWAKATFSGWVKASSTDSLEITNGSLLGKIAPILSK